MNPLNYATLETCQRLQAAGIVLETDYYWDLQDDGSYKITPSEKVYWARKSETFRRAYPIPSMAEVWRELPQCYTDGRDNYLLTAQATIYKGRYRVGYYDPAKGVWLKYFEGADNSLDDDLNLLIWVTEQKKEKV